MQSRRTFLKLMGLGLAGVALHKLLPLRLPGIGSAGSPLKHFAFRERGGRLVFYNARGKRLFTLSDDGEIVVG